jgi:2-keto-4-pentenoate hydratase
MTMDRKSVDQAAEALASAWKSGKLLDSLPAGCSPTTVDEALEIQAAMIARLGETVAGWKVARPPSGEMLSGTILKPRLFANGARVPASLTPLRGVEAEIAFHFNKPLPARASDYTREEVEDVVTAFIGFEIVDSRFRDYKGAPLFDKTADLQSNGGFVVGPNIPDWRRKDLVNIEVTLKVNGEVKHQAKGGHPQKDPLLPAIAFANLRRQSGGIGAGQMVTTGTYTGMTFVKPGDAMSVHFEGVDPVAFSFTD